MVAEQNALGEGLRCRVCPLAGTKGSNSTIDILDIYCPLFGGNRHVCL